MATLRQPICLVACEKGQMVCKVEKLKRSLIMMYLRTVTTAQMIKLTSYPTAYWLVGAGEAYVRNVYTNIDRGLRDGMYKIF